MNEELSIGGLARQVGVNIETIRYYERIGLMPRASRTATGRRIYDERAASTLAFIRRARELGFGLQDTRMLLELRSTDNGCKEFKALEVERILSQAIERCPGGATINCTIMKVLENIS